MREKDPMTTNYLKIRRRIDSLARRMKSLSTKEASAFYREKIFPEICGLHEFEARDREPARLLFAAVGTQPFSPALALIANPHQKAILLYTDGTKRLLSDVRELYQGGMTTFEKGVVETAYIGDGTDSVRAMDVIYSKYLVEGEPPPHDVVVDVTSGRKATAAAMGAIAAARDFRQVYLEGDPHPTHPQLVFTTRHVQLPSALLLCGQDLRNRAVALIQAGAPRHAEKVLKSLIEKGFAGKTDRLCHGIVTWWARATQARFPQAFKECKRLISHYPEDFGKLEALPLAEVFETRTGRNLLTAAMVRSAQRKGQKELAVLCARNLPNSRKGEVHEIARSILLKGPKLRAKAAETLVRTFLRKVWNYGN